MAQVGNKLCPSDNKATSKFSSLVFRESQLCAGLHYYYVTVVASHSCTSCNSIKQFGPQTPTLPVKKPRA
jgi:hypothetical protein